MKLISFIQFILFSQFSMYVWSNSCPSSSEHIRREITFNKCHGFIPGESSKSYASELSFWWGRMRILQMKWTLSRWKQSLTLSRLSSSRTELITAVYCTSHECVPKRTQDRRTKHMDDGCVTKQWKYAHTEKWWIV